MPFQVAIKLLIRIIFRTVRRQKENLYLLFMFIQPRRYDLAMVDSEIVQDKNNLPADVLDPVGT